MKAKCRNMLSLLFGIVCLLMIAPKICLCVCAYGIAPVQGDLNSDGKVSVADAVFLMRFLTEDEPISLSSQIAADSDVNADGYITMTDVQTFVQIYILHSSDIVPEHPYTETTAMPVQTQTSTETTTVSAAYNTDYIQNLKTIPPYDQQAYITVNQNLPYYTVDSTETTAFEYYSPLDALGRCGRCEACIGTELMPTEERGSIGMVKPSGWQLARYDGIVDGNYLYNRCHLIGFQLTGENANVCNLITGTRYLNVTGMLPFENQTADYIKKTGNHVRYRVTPYFENDDLVASGVLMEALSVEDNGNGLRFNVFCYNVQPQIFIDYANGDNHLIDTSGEQPDTPPQNADYVVNTNTKKFHLPDCSAAADIAPKNRMDFTGSREELIEQGYSPCKRCDP